MEALETAIVVGVGPGLGWALVKRFAADNMRVGAVARDSAKLKTLIDSATAHNVRPYVADVSKVQDVVHLFHRLDHGLGEPDLVVFNAGAYQRGNIVDIDPADFERCWRI